MSVAGPVTERGGTSNLFILHFFFFIKKRLRKKDFEKKDFEKKDFEKKDFEKKWLWKKNLEKKRSGKSRRRQLETTSERPRALFFHSLGSKIPPTCRSQSARRSPYVGEVSEGRKTR